MLIGFALELLEWSSLLTWHGAFKAFIGVWAGMTAGDRLSASGCAEGGRRPVLARLGETETEGRGGVGFIKVMRREMGLRTSGL